METTHTALPAVSPDANELPTHMGLVLKCHCDVHTSRIDHIGPQLTHPTHRPAPQEMAGERSRGVCAPPSGDGVETTHVALPAVIPDANEPTHMGLVLKCHAFAM